MKNAFRELLPVGVVLLLGASPGSLLLAQSEQSGAVEGEAVPIVTGLELEGELRAVDLDRSFFLIVAENGDELMLHYDDETEVTGQTDSVQGLTGQSGTWVLVDYRAEGQRAVAERIELVETGQASETESADPSEASPEP